DRFWDLVDLLSNARMVHVTSLLDPDSAGVLADLLGYVAGRHPGLCVSFDPGHVWANGGDGVGTEAVGRLLSLTSLLFLSEGELAAAARTYAGVMDDAVPERDLAEALLNA